VAAKKSDIDECKKQIDELKRAITRESKINLDLDEMEPEEIYKEINNIKELVTQQIKTKMQEIKTMYSKLLKDALDNLTTEIKRIETKLKIDMKKKVIQTAAQEAGGLSSAIRSQILASNQLKVSYSGAATLFEELGKQDRSLVEKNSILKMIESVKFTDKLTIIQESKASSTEFVNIKINITI
jgi:hypothetical protein